VIKPELISLLESESRLYRSTIHGLPHWKTVERNGIYLSEHTGADSKVISYFSYFHDCMRVNEDHDPEHGPRAARFLKEKRDALGLTDDQFKQLYHACSGHTHGRKCHDITVCTCWDADRLDIGRIDARPNSKLLFSDEAKRIADDDDQLVLVRHGFVNDVY
jgi:uncharacterized protein